MDWAAIGEWLRRTTINRLLRLARWLLIAVTTGIVLGSVGAVFAKSIVWVTAFRRENPAVLYGLPLAGLVIVFCYHFEKKDAKSSTNLVLDAIHAERKIPLLTAPLIFISTILTHLFGGSAGREGAALQLGGSIGQLLGVTFLMDETDQRVVIMCGMSAAFSALFGTPLAAAVFPMEVVSVGIMQYAALVPCALAALAASMTASYLGVGVEAFSIGPLPVFTAELAARMILLGVLCAAVSIFFCVVVHGTEHGLKRFFPNPYLRAAAAGICLIVLTKLLGTTDYLGAGMDVAGGYIEDGAPTWAFLLKTLFTAVTLGGGYKGGEIVPTLFVGAAFGSLAGGLLGIPTGLAAACGMAAVFCGVTNCPITSLLISFELFGFDGAPFFLLAVGISYMQSGYYGLYHSQKIMYAKDKIQFVNKNTKE